MGSERFKKTNLTRREFFLRSSAAVAGGITVGAVDVATEPFLLIDAFSSPERGKKTNEQLRNAIPFETKNAQYTIAYSNHGIKTNPELLNKKDGVILELTNPTEKAAEYVDNMTQYYDLAPEAYRKNIPLFLPDVLNEDDAMMDRGIYTKRYVGITEAAMGGGLIGAGIMEMARRPDRRNFLNGIGGTALGSYLASRTPEKVAFRMSGADLDAEPDAQSSSFKVFTRLSILNSALHPETRTLTLETRTTLIAEKTERIAEKLKNEKGQKPHLLIAIGAVHAGLLEKDLADGTENRSLKLKRGLKNNYSAQARVVVIWGRIPKGRDPSSFRKIDDFFSSPYLEIQDLELR